MTKLVESFVHFFKNMNECWCIYFMIPTACKIFMMLLTRHIYTVMILKLNNLSSKRFFYAFKSNSHAGEMEKCLHIYNGLGKIYQLRFSFSQTFIFIQRIAGRKRKTLCKRRSRISTYILSQYHTYNNN